jgi:hypothetical protein
MNKLPWSLLIVIVLGLGCRSSTPQHPVVNQPSPPPGPDLLTILVFAFIGHASLPEPASRPVTDSDLVGRWRYLGDYETTRVEIDFASDHKFSQTVTGQNGVSKTQVGTWKLEGAWVELHDVLLNDSVSGFKISSWNPNSTSWWFSDQNGYLELNGGECSDPDQCSPLQWMGAPKIRTQDFAEVVKKAADPSELQQWAMTILQETARSNSAVAIPRERIPASIRNLTMLGSSFQFGEGVAGPVQNRSVVLFWGSLFGGPWAGLQIGPPSFKPVPVPAQLYYIEWKPGIYFFYFTH